MSIDNSPAAIAARLMTANATYADRQLVEALAMHAIRLSQEIQGPGQTDTQLFFSVERLMVRAAMQVAAQADVRNQRLLDAIADLATDTETP